MTCRRNRARSATATLISDGDTETLILEAPSRRAWLHPAVSIWVPFRPRRTEDSTVTAITRVLRDGGYLLEEYAVRRSVRALLRDLAAGGALLVPTQVIPGVVVLVEALNGDGSAKIARVSRRRATSHR